MAGADLPGNACGSQVIRRVPSTGQHLGKGRLCSVKAGWLPVRLDQQLRPPGHGLVRGCAEPLAPAIVDR
jgi:hypothetical protein